MMFDARKDLLAALISNRDKIEAHARNPIDRGRYEGDGSILIKTSDC